MLPKQHDIFIIFLVVTGAQEFSIFDIQSPASFTLKSTLSFPYALDVAVTSDFKYVYVPNKDGLHVINISDKNNPVMNQTIFIN